MHYPVSTYTLPIIVLISGLLAHEPALAQGADELIEEIVVTARGREESLIEVPISETVFDSQAIKDARIDRVDDFIALTPNVTISNAQDSGTNFITIRGLSQTRNGEPPVAVVVDGVLQTSPRSFDQGLFDVESIEVLRGPQGALYGRNATGGALLINTVGPTEEFEVTYRVPMAKQTNLESRDPSRDPSAIKLGSVYRPATTIEMAILIMLLATKMLAPMRNS